MNVLFRADASPAMGIGHVMRCLAIAEALHDLGARCSFALAEATGSVEQRLVAEGAEVHRLDPAEDRAAEATRALMRRSKSAAVVVDGYQFTAEWRRALRGEGRPVLTFQDHADDPPPEADIIVNPAADPSAATVFSGGTQYLCGPRYVLLRRELREAAAMPLPAMAARRSVLVAFGGTDPLRMSLPVSAALVRRLGPAVPIRVAIGSGTAEAPSVAEQVRSLGPQVDALLEAPRMGRLMADAGLAVSAAGGTVRELAALGVPSIVAIVADNQAQGAATAAADGWCLAVDGRTSGAEVRIADLAAGLWADPARREAMASRARSLVDGRGAERVASALLAHARIE